ncbi:MULTISPECIES: TetR/AcrR family transcriptional regulator [Micromonospora]|uniref:TetR family transcriptional regulator n=1 Tax=Micromonospora maris TaxID=1003110 RepID=A0A9X0LCS2_9ACTN|nr:MULTISPECIES: TetR/AcrR family transcriptional regulator [Micromonospora]AEB46014.1 TetR family transcriptional regulator [Micromonospora maris AB-18-032]KUJ45311.1 TetR family transcriptional regulator [Micromonospora maris]RUL94631.1 TetR/AcrR family transcriptional regulator [Verrucosispora sp. FIM060022]
MTIDGTARRADARRNVESILEAATALLATDPAVSVNEIARAAGVGRVTLYGHFPSRAALVEAVSRRVIASTDQALDAVDLDGDAREAMARLLAATWQLTYRFGAIVVAASDALTPEEMRRVHEEPARRMRALVERGRDEGVFRRDMPLSWQLTTVQAVLHGASAAVHRGDVPADDATRLVTDTVLAALAVTSSG